MWWLVIVWTFSGTLLIGVQKSVQGTLSTAYSLDLEMLSYWLQCSVFWVAKYCIGWQWPASSPHTDPFSRVLTWYLYWLLLTKWLGCQAWPHSRGVCCAVGLFYSRPLKYRAAYIQTVEKSVDFNESKPVHFRHLELYSELACVANSREIEDLSVCARVWFGLLACCLLMPKHFWHVTDQKVILS